MTDSRSPIARARGLGAAGQGTRHWLHQRLTGLANLVLVFWFASSIVALAGADYTTVVWWIRDPVVSVLLLLLLASSFYHLSLGLRVVIEDYVSGEGLKLFLIYAVGALSILLALLGGLSVLKIALGG